MLISNVSITLVGNSLSYELFMKTSIIGCRHLLVTQIHKRIIMKMQLYFYLMRQGLIDRFRQSIS